MLFALIFLISSFGKAWVPGPMAQALAWTGLPFHLRIAITDTWGAIEALLAGAILLLGRSVVVCWSALIVASILLVVHIGMDSSDCGCFGELRVPGGLVLALLVTGALGSMISARTAPAQPYTHGALRCRVPATMAFAVAALLPMLVRSMPRLPPEEVVLAQAGIQREGVPALLIVGSGECPHCLAELDSIARRRTVSPTTAALRMVFVVRVDDVSAALAVRKFYWLELLRVADELWWTLLLDRPPTYLRVAPDRPLRLSRTWQ